MLKAGDRVRVVKGHYDHLTLGDIYTVTRVVTRVDRKDFVFVGSSANVESCNGWYPDRFELVDSGQEVLDALRKAVMDARDLGHTVECKITVTTTSEENL